MNIIELKTVEAYEELTTKNPAAVVHFGARWNSFDRTMLRTLVELEPEFSGKVKFGFIDIDENATIEVLRQIDLVNVPTLAYFKNGENVLTRTGMRPMDDIRQQIQSLLD